MSTLALQTIIDGPRNVVIKGYITGDGTALTDSKLVDVSTLSGAPSEVKITRILAFLGGFTATLEWDAGTDKAIMDIPDGEHVDWNFERFGGLINDATSPTGDINITTPTSDPASGETGFILIECDKKA